MLNYNIHVYNAVAVVVYQYYVCIVRMCINNFNILVENESIMFGL